MSQFTDLASYISATGLWDANFPSETDKIFESRHNLLNIIYNLAYINIAPYNTWMEANRVFFTPTGPVSYTIGGITYNLTAPNTYAMNPQEYMMANQAAVAAGVTLTLTNFAGWVGVGSLDLFYW